MRPSTCSYMYDLTPSPSHKEVGLSTHSTIFPGSLNSPDNGCVTRQKPLVALLDKERWVSSLFANLSFALQPFIFDGGRSSAWFITRSGQWILKLASAQQDKHCTSWLKKQRPVKIYCTGASDRCILQPHSFPAKMGDSQFIQPTQTSEMATPLTSNQFTPWKYHPVQLDLYSGACYLGAIWLWWEYVAFAQQVEINQTGQ